MAKKQIRTDAGKVSFQWDEQACTFTFHDNPAVFHAVNLDDARSQVRAMADTGTLPRVKEIPETS